jgi:tRNA(Ile)-lysidine synthase
MAARRAEPSLLHVPVTALTRRTERRVYGFAAATGALAAGENVLVAVSGGPDSSALLVVLSRLARRLNLRLTAAHFSHLLRSAEETEADLAFVRLVAGRLGVPVVHGAGHVRQHAGKTGRSMEAAARELRYRFLGEAAKAEGATAVALGHTVDDQAETVLLHIIRGSGLDGLAGMRPRSGWPFGKGPQLGRPLLGLRRAGTVAYCAELGLEPREDPTNELLVAARNRIRHRLLPELRALNPRIAEALARLADAAARDLDYIEPAVDEAWRRTVQAAPDEVSFPKADVLALPPAIGARLLRRAVGALAGSAADLEAVQVESLLAALGRRRYRISLPHGLSAQVSERAIVVRRGEPEKDERLPDAELAVPGVTAAGPWLFQAEIVPRLRQAGKVRRERLEAFLDADTVSLPLRVRSRRPGDRLRPLGLGGQKKLQDVLVDGKVPAGRRDGVPVVYDGKGIVWVVGHCLDERAALRGTTRRVVHIRARGQSR